MSVKVSTRSQDNSSRYYSIHSINEDESINDFFSDTALIQKQYKFYHKHYDDNYKSWSTHRKSELLSNKEYIEIWEWFRDTLKNVELEEGIVLKTIAYHCLANGLFETYAEAASFFEPMNFSHDNLVGSFMELIKTLSITTIPENATLRAYVKKWQSRKGPLNAGFAHPKTQKDFIPEEHSLKDGSTIDEENTCHSIRNEHHHIHNGALSSEFTNNASKKFVKIAPASRNPDSSDETAPLSPTREQAPRRMSFSLNVIKNIFGGTRGGARIGTECIPSDDVPHVNRVTVHRGNQKVTDKRRESIVSSISSSVRTQLSRITSFGSV